MKLSACRVGSPRPNSIALLTLAAISLTGCSERAEEARVDRAIAPYVASARKSWPDAKKQFLAGLGKDTDFYVTIRLHDGARFHHFLVLVEEIDGTRITGRLRSSTTMMPAHRIQDPVVTSELEIYDWQVDRPGKDRDEGGGLKAILESLN